MIKPSSCLFVSVFMMQWCNHSPHIQGHQLTHKSPDWEDTKWGSGWIFLEPAEESTHHTIWTNVGWCEIRNRQMLLWTIPDKMSDQNVIDLDLQGDMCSSPGAARLLNMKLWHSTASPPKRGCLNVHFCKRNQRMPPSSLPPSLSLSKRTLHLHFSCFCL